MLNSFFGVLEPKLIFEKLPLPKHRVDFYAVNRHQLCQEVEYFFGAKPDQHQKNGTTSESCIHYQFLHTLYVLMKTNCLNKLQLQQAQKKALQEANNLTATLQENDQKINSSEKDTINHIVLLLYTIGRLASTSTTRSIKIIDDELHKALFKLKISLDLEEKQEINTNYHDHRKTTYI